MCGVLKEYLPHHHTHTHTSEQPSKQASKGVCDCVGETGGQSAWGDQKKRPAGFFSFSCLSSSTSFFSSLESFWGISTLTFTR